MAQLTAWLRKHFLPKSNSKKQHLKEPPYLPSTRRPITPTSLKDPTCLFFGLPADIRSIILTMAFGGCTLHVDVVRQNQARQWRGAVCNRNLPGQQPSMQHMWISPFHDSCLEDVYGRKGRDVESYNVGIMGFLLSSRQAYTEGIEFLYSTNCINIQSEALLLHLPQLVLPKRLACIKALEIMIRVHHIQDTGGPSLNLDHLKPILDNITTHCCSLRSIYLSFTTQNWDDREVGDLALPLVDAFYQSTQLRSMIVELPPESYGALFSSRSLNNHPDEEMAMVRFPKSLWRSLDGDIPMVQRRSLEPYPYPPLRFPVLGSGSETMKSVGYWLTIGFDQATPLSVVCF